MLNKRQKEKVLIVEQKIKIYTLADPNTNEIRYVGKTKNSLEKRFGSHCSKSKTRKSHCYNWIQSLKANNQKPIIELIDLVSKKEWQFWEKHYISLFKSWGFNLCNHLQGGDGPEGGYTFSENIRKKFGHKPWNKGITHSEETKKKISEKLKGRIGPWAGTKGIKKATSGSFKKHQVPYNKTSLSTEQELEIIEKYNNKELTQKQISKLYKIHRTTFNKIKYKFAQETTRKSVNKE